MALMATIRFYSNWNLHKIQQTFKWVVYLLLFVNYCFYIEEDWSAATYTLGQDAGLAQWLSAFATTIDETAWFILLIKLELETYVLDDEQFTPSITILLHAISVICFTMIAYTIFAFGQYVVDVRETVPVEDVTMRMMARGREDDTEEAIARRLSLYEEQTAPLLDWFAERGLLAMIDGLGEEEQVFSRLTEVIDGRMA